MRRTTLALAVAAVLGLGVQPALATKPTSAPKPKTTAQAPKSQAPKAPKTTTTHGPKAPKTTTASAPKSASAASAKSPKASKTTTTTTSPTPTSPTSPTGTWTPTNPIAEKIMGKPNQLAKLQSLLPPGTDLNNATLGFKNFGQLNAAVNNCINHNLSFADLKAAMTGVRIDGTKTGLAPVSLGQAKKQLQTTTTGPTGDSRQ